MQGLTELAKLDPLTRAKRSTDMAAETQDLLAEISRIRREALNELIAEGMTQQEIATQLGVTRARVGALLSAGPKPERALLGTGTLTIAVGGKPEGPRAHGGTPSTVISAEATKARDLIAETASIYDLDVVHEVVDPPGMVDLNRPNLVVVGSPRLLPFVAQVLQADRHLGFRQGTQGWYLTAGDTVHRSPADSGASSDYAYIGRLPRPDGKGTFLYLAGIHAPGTLGAAHYLCGNITELYDQVKSRRWSVLIECTYNPDDTREIITTRPITPIYS